MQPSSAAVELSTRFTWLERSPPAALPSGEVHFWRAEVGRQERRGWASLLSEEERRRATGFLRPEDRRRYVEGRAMLRELVGRYCGADPAEVELRVARKGKPELAPGWGPIDLQFSISHSEGLVMLAFAVGAPVGIDVEALRPLPDARELAGRYLTRAEQCWLDGVPDPSAGFLRVWTLKEAYLKATGEGLGGLYAVEVAPSDPARILLPHAGWAARSVAPAEGYVAAVVHQSWR
jgi:4'-phosphopantetheinyl transferase